MDSKNWRPLEDGLKESVFAGEYFPMAETGYSGSTLLHKLGIKPGMKLLLINQPEEYYALMEKEVCRFLYTKNELPDPVHLFGNTQKAFETEMKKLISQARNNTTLIIGIS